MTIADKLVIIAENEPKIYDKGYTDANNYFWNVYQNNGNAKDYKFAFAGLGWNNGTFKPKHNIITTNAQYVFAQNNAWVDLKQYCEDNNITISFIGDGLYGEYTFFASKFSKLPYMDMALVKGLNYTFRNCTRLTELSFSLNELGTQTFNNTFTGSTEIENLTIPSGVIGQNDFNVSTCTKLTHDSLMSIINALKDFTTYITVTERGTSLPIGYKIVDFEFVVGEETLKYSDSKSSIDNYYIDLFDSNNDPIPAVHIGTTIDKFCTYGYGGVTYTDEEGYPKLYNLSSVILRSEPSTTKTITLGSTNLAKLTSNEISIATQKGWSMV